MAPATSSYLRAVPHFSLRAVRDLAAHASETEQRSGFIGPLVNFAQRRKEVKAAVFVSAFFLSLMRISDVAHGFKVGELSIKSDEIKKGKETLAQFTPNETGHYVGQCVFLRIRPRIDETTN